MKIEARYTQVSDTSHGCDHAELHAIVDDGWQMIQCVRCLKRWDSQRGKRRPFRETALDETHDFQRFEQVTLEGERAPKVKIVCRCGWSSICHDHDPDTGAAIVVARNQLREHLDAIANDRRWTAEPTEKVP